MKTITKEDIKNLRSDFGPSKPPHITEKDTGIWRRLITNEKCWKTGNYTDSCNCESCMHKHECSGYEGGKDDE